MFNFDLRDINLFDDDNFGSFNFGNKDEDTYNYNINLTEDISNNKLINEKIEKCTKLKTEFKFKIIKDINNSKIPNEDLETRKVILESQKKESNKVEEKKDEIEEKQINTGLPPIQYDYNKIQELFFNKLNGEDKIKNSFINSEYLINIQNSMSDETFLGPKKRNRDTQIIQEETKKFGRKKKNDNSESKHNKYSLDNIMKKIKSKILKKLVEFVNTILNSFLNKEKILSYTKIMNSHNKNTGKNKDNLIKYLDYQIINETSKEKNLEYLKMPLKDIVSKNIYGKYSILSQDSNKIIIDEIYKNEKDNEIINFVFNLTFRDWLDIFIYKKELKDIKNIGNLNNEVIKEINSKFEHIYKSFIEDIYKLSKESDYFSCFIFILYNFERWFFIKKSRQKRVK